MSAVSGGNIDIVRMLIDSGADLSSETGWGDSALSLATRNGQEDIANYFADAGAILPHSAPGRRASVVAARKGLQQLVRRLTADYAVVAMQGLRRQRQNSRIQVGVANIVENGDELNEMGQTGVETKTEAHDSQDSLNDNLSEAMEGLEYNRGFAIRYSLLDRIGRGASAAIYICASKVTEVKYALKVYTSKKDKQKNIYDIRHEIAFLKQLRQENIARMVEEVVDDMKQVYIVIELGAEGSCLTLLFSRSNLLR